MSRASALLSLVVLACSGASTQTSQDSSPLPGPTPPAESMHHVEMSDAHETVGGSPPTGTYELRMRVVSDSCAPVPAASSTPLKVGVTVSTEHDATGVANVATDVSPDGAVLGRMNLELRRGALTEHIRTLPFCPSYKETSAIEVLSVSPTELVLSTVTQYGDAASCPELARGNCRTERVLRYALLTPAPR